MADLDKRTRASLDAVLENACQSLPHGGDHALRKEVARQLLRSVRKGNRAPGELDLVARTALIEATRRKPA